MESLSYMNYIDVGLEFGRRKKIDRIIFTGHLKYPAKYVPLLAQPQTVGITIIPKIIIAKNNLFSYKKIFCLTK